MSDHTPPSEPDPDLSGPEAVCIGKLQPKLRMLANGSTEVNCLRAGHAAAVCVSREVAERYPARRSDDSTPASDPPVGEIGDAVPAPQAKVSVFLGLTSDAAGRVPEALSEMTTSQRADLLTAEVSVADAMALNRNLRVSSVELGQPLALPTAEPGARGVDAPRSRVVGDPAQHRNGAGVLIGLIDVGGFDFAHPDFLDKDGHTRFVRIWDQGSDTRPPPDLEGSPVRYGAELRQEHLNRAIDGQAEFNLPATELEPQSQMGEGAHATHVASIAAGGTGVCPEAWIAGVLVDIPREESARRESFYDSTRVAHAVDYLIAVAEDLRREHKLRTVPVSINISLGTNGHAHDASAAMSRWIDLALSRPGRSVCVAAGNAGQERAEHAGDVGWLMGRVHTSGRVPATGLAVDIEWNVIGNGIADLSENELELWYGAQDRLSVQVKPPDLPWTDPVAAGQYIENRELPDGTFLSVYNEVYHPVNGANYIAIYLSPRLQDGPITGVRAGEWLVRLNGTDIRDGTYHGWIERDDPRQLGRIGPRDTWAFPSCFSERSMVDASTISSLACGDRIVAVANLDEAKRRVSVTSSQGPTRDGREKPDIAAPGTRIVAANGFSNAGDWIEMSGTSMASPYVAGVIGLMLAINPDLTAAQINGILKRAAQPLPGTDFAWCNDAGSGALDPALCLQGATGMLDREDVT
ncbi:S8 family serine peptidase [Solirubrobacter phytolaccae]|uniref:S8 family serine peptidase n=1 Tax=Solirubrobacter phytolaccae TaxID=1404360 RepID=A0A9X3SIR5_9ACTN|nr:S8 family serine peptidase [Solirubrobacter phytolaccae]MDA0184457.1 S8 family serine peptidase [Solirubrobacter phytolaccae]